MSQTFLEDIPEFLEVQRNSFLRILDTGLIQAFGKINPIVPTSQCKYGLLFYPNEYVLILPENTITETFLQGKTYGCKIYVPASIYNIESSSNLSRTGGKRFRSFKAYRLTKPNNSRFSEETFLNFQENSFNASIMAGESKPGQTKHKANLKDSSRILSWSCFLRMHLAMLDARSLSKKNNLYQGVSGQYKNLLSRNRKNKLNNFLSKLTLTFTLGKKQDLRSLLGKESRSTSQETINSMFKAPSLIVSQGSKSGLNSIKYFYPRSSEPHKQILKPTLRSLLKRIDNKNSILNLTTAQRTVYKLTETIKEENLIANFSSTGTSKHQKTSVLYDILPKKIRQKSQLGFFHKKAIWLRGRSNTSLIHETLNRLQLEKYDWFLGDEKKGRGLRAMPLNLGGREPCSTKAMKQEGKSPINDSSSTPHDLGLREWLLPFSKRSLINSKGSILDLKPSQNNIGDDILLKNRNFSSLDSSLFLSNRAKPVYRKEWVCIGVLPLMTPRGHFIINGSHRIIISQMARAPGLYYQTGEKVQATIVPSKGAWLRLSVKASDNGEIKIWVRITPQRKMPYKIFIETYKHLEISKAILSKKYGKQTQQTWQSKFLNLTIKTLNSKIKHLDKHYAVGVVSGQINRTLLNPSSYSLGTLGRKRLNERLNINEKKGYLTSKDISLIKDNLLKLLGQKSSDLSLDDIDHLENRRVRTCGELLQTEIETGMARLKKAIGKQLDEYSNPDSSLFNTFKSTAIENRNKKASSNIVYSSQNTSNNASFSGLEQGLTSLGSEGNMGDKKGFGSQELSSTTAMKAQSQRFNDSSSLKGSSSAVLRKNSNQQTNKVNFGNRGTIYRSKNTNNLFWLKTLNLQNWEFYTANVNQILTLFKEKKSAPFWKKNTNLLFFNRKLYAFLTLYKLGIELYSPLHDSKSQGRSAQKPWSPQQAHQNSLYEQISGPTTLLSLPSSRSTQGHYLSKETLATSTHYKLQTQSKKIGITLAQARLSTENLKFLNIKKKTIQNSCDWLFSPETTSFLDARHVTPSISKTPSQEFYKEKSTLETENSLKLLSPSKIIGTKAFAGALREFFGSNPLSQYMDQTNPLAEITHKRRLSSLGPGGIDRASAGIAIRGIHPSHYGRICPIETPEGKNAGLVNSMTMWARINSEGFLETPYFQVTGGSLMSQTDNLIPAWNFIPTKRESRGALKIVSSDLKITESAFLPSIGLPTRDGSERSFGRSRRDYVNFCGISPMQNISVATSLIPFLEHDDATRALMGSNMQRQAVPLLKAKEPLIRTGLEGKVVGESGHALQASCSGIISTATRTSITIDSFDIVKNRKVAIRQNFSHLVSMAWHPGDLGVLAPKETQSMIVPQHLVYSKVIKQEGNTINDCVSTAQRAITSYYSSNLSAKQDLIPSSILSKGLLSRYPGNNPSKNRKFIGNVKNLSFLKGSFFKNSRGLYENSLRFFLAPKPINSVVYTINYSFKEAFKGWLGSSCQIGSLYNKICSQAQKQQQLLILSKEDAMQSKEVNNAETWASNLQQLQNGTFYQNKVLKTSKVALLNLPRNLKQERIPRLKQLWRENFKVKRNRKIHDLQQYTRSNQATVCVQRPAVTEGRWVQKGDLIGDCSASKNGILALGQNIVVAYLPMEGFNFEDAIVVSDRLVHEELYTSIHVQRVEFDMDALMKKHIPRKIKIKKQKSAYKTNNQDWITLNNPHLLESEKQNLNPLGIINVGSWVGPGDVLVSKVFPVERKIAPSRHLLAAVFQEKKTKILDTDDTSVRVPKGIHGRVINVKIVGAGKTATVPLMESCEVLSLKKHKGRETSPTFSLLCETIKPIKLNLAEKPTHLFNGDNVENLDAGKGETTLFNDLQKKTIDTPVFSDVTRSLESQREQPFDSFDKEGKLDNFYCNKETRFFSLDYLARNAKITESLNKRRFSSFFRKKKNTKILFHNLTAKEQSTIIGCYSLLGLSSKITNNGGLRTHTYPSLVLREFLGLSKELSFPVPLGWLGTQGSTGSKKSLAIEGYPKSLSHSLKGTWSEGNTIDDCDSTLSSNNSSYLPLQNTRPGRDYSNDIGSTISATEQGGNSVPLSSTRLRSFTNPFRFLAPRSDKPNLTGDKALLKTSSPWPSGNATIYDCGSTPLSPEGSLNTPINNIFSKTNLENRNSSDALEQNTLYSRNVVNESSFSQDKEKIQELHLDQKDKQSSNLAKRKVTFQQLKSKSIYKKPFHTQEYKITGVRIYIAERKKLQVGDKMSGRHGNKGIVSTILPREDMPYLPDGTPIDMVLNPLGIPSRMNVGQVFECLLGLAASVCGESIGHTPFDEMYGPEASRSLVYLFLYVSRLRSHYDWIFQPNFPGKTVLFDGRTGTPFEQWVTVGRAYMLKLIHMVDEKIHARSIGPRSLVTQQPVKGRARGGGQRLGEMEVWALEGFGAAYTLQEILTIKSDDIKGREEVENSIISATALAVHIPETFRITLFELRCLCLNLELNQNF